MQYKSFVLILVLLFDLNDRTISLCSKFPWQIRLRTKSETSECFLLGQCHLSIITSNDHHHIRLKQNDIDQWLNIFFLPSSSNILIEHNEKRRSLLVSSVINTTEISTSPCFNNTERGKRALSSSSTPTILTFNSSSFIDYHYSGTTLQYPLRLSVRFRTIGRILNGVLLSLTHRSSTSILPYIIIEHSNGKIEITILQLDERKILSPVTTVQAGKNINNDHWHWLQFEIDDNGIFTVVVDDDSRTSQIPSYVVVGWNINGLLVADTRRLSADIFQPFIGYMSDLVFNDEHLFARFQTHKEQQIRSSSFQYKSENLLVGYRIAFFNLVTINTATSYIAFSERESQNKNHGKLDIYFLFRSYVPDGIILYRYAQGLNEYFAIGLRAGILAVFIDFGFGKRQIVSDESTKLADGKWHEVRVTRLGTDKIELIVDNRVNRSTLSTNGIRNAVSLQPVLYIGGIPNSNSINLTGSGLNAQGFQGCLASFVVDGRLLDYQRALVLNGQVKMNVCSDTSNLLTSDDHDLNKLCYDFTCLHSGVCSTNGNDGPRCDCIETGFTGERCDKLPRAFYFGKHHSIGLIDYVLPQARQTEYDIIVFGIQTLSMSAQIFRLESDVHFYSLEYEIVRGRSYIKLHLGDKQPDVYSGVAHITDGTYHVIKILRRLSTIEFYVDGIRIKLDGGQKPSKQVEQRTFLAQRRLRIGSFKNLSQWNGILAGFSFNRQSIFDSLSKSLIRSGDVDEVYPDEQTGLFNLMEPYYIATAIISSTTVSTAKILNTITSETSTVLTTLTSSVKPWLDESQTRNETSLLAPRTNRASGITYDWFYQYLRRFGFRGLLIISIISISLLCFLIVIIVHLHWKNRQAMKNPAYPHNHSNGKVYSPIMARHSHSSSKRRSTSKFLRYFRWKAPKAPPSSSSFRFTSNGSMSRLNSGDSYHLISSIQENHSEKKRVTSNCNHHSTSSGTLYHQVNRLIATTNDPPLPSAHIVGSHSSMVPMTATLRSLKKDLDHSSVQTYSAVYSCELAANFDLNADCLSPKRRRSIGKVGPSTFDQNTLVYLFLKNLVDCYAIQSDRHRPVLLATADENRIQLSHARSGHFHSQLPISSVGACHQMIYSYQDQYLIGLFYEVTSNVNPYAVKIWSTEDYSLRTNIHPIKCSIALASKHSPILYMAGKQKYGRGISLGLLDLDSSSLARELKSDPDTSIGDEIKRIILTKNESYALVACTEYNSTSTCFVVFKLDHSNHLDEEPSSAILGSMSNCTMILTRFDCDANFTFSILDSNNNGDQYMLTILRSNQILIWQLTDGEILFNYDFNFLTDENSTDSEHQDPIADCQMDENRLIVLTRHGFIHIWDITVPLGEFSLLTSLEDSLIRGLSWLDHQHFLSIDNDGQRVRLWNISQKESIEQCLCLSSRIQSLHVHPLINKATHRQEYLVVGSSLNERSLVLFQCYLVNEHSKDSTR